MSLPYSDPQTGDRLRRMEASQLRQQVFLAMRDLLLLESYNLPLMLVLDDLHWADEVSLDLVYFLLEVLRQSPIFILAISRTVEPGPLERVVNWARQNLADRFRHIPLQNLSLDQSKQLLALLLSIPDLPEGMRELIVHRAAGVPFYLEEILRMLIDQGMIQNENGRWQVVPGADVASMGVPDTLQELILARFDRLQPGQRKLLQVASVIGKDFSLPVLSTVLQGTDAPVLHVTLDAVVEREFVMPQSGALDTEYTFRHILMSDAIYGTMLRKDRSALHGQVADCIERLYADRLEEQVEVLANHYRWSPRQDRALHYLILAGQKAARNNVNQQARQNFDVALELLPNVSHSAYQGYQVYSGMGDALLFAGDYAEARTHYEYALQTLAQGEEGTYIEENSSLQRKIARTSERQGDYDQAVAHLDMAQNTLNALPMAFPVERAQVWNDLAWIYFRRGNFAEADKLLNRALDLVKATDAYDVIASIYNRLGGVAYNQGDWEGAATFLRRSIAMRESIRDLANLATSFNNLGLLEIEMGHFDSALENLTRSFELKTRLGQAEGVAMALNNLGWLRIQRGELEEASHALQQALDLSQQIGYTSLYWQVLANMGEKYLAAEDWEQARRVLDETARAWQDLGVTDQLADNYRQLGEAALGCGNIEAALGWVKKAGDLLETIGNAGNGHSAVWRARYLRLRGRLAIHLGDWYAAQAYLEESRGIFQKLRSRLDQARILFCLGQLAQAQGDHALAKERYIQASAIFRAVGARLDAQRAEQASSK
jgi:predicted ATPase